MSYPPDVLAERTEAKLEGLGRALVGGLLQACLAHGVEVATGCRGVRLLQDNENNVVGVEIETATGRRSVPAGAVVLATGGFEYDSDLVRDFLRGPLTRPVGAPTNTGDGLRMAMRIGAQLGNMREAWWSPVVSFPGLRRDGGRNGLLSARERALPGSIMVNRHGRRFANEAANYNAFGGAFHQLDESRLDYPNIPAYMIFDQSTVDQFGVFGVAPGGELPDWVTRADTLDELAEAFGLPVAALRATVERFNTNAEAGVDPDFGRGDSAYDRFPGGCSTGDPDSASATLGPVETPRSTASRSSHLGAGHEGRTAHRPRRPRARRRRRRDPRALRRRQRDGQPGRHGLRRRRGHPGRRRRVGSLRRAGRCRSDRHLATDVRDEDNQQLETGITE